MSNEAAMKKIELKVSVNCCDGCKKRVKKVLQSIEGVMKTEIDSCQPKVTVIGNVDPHILIKALHSRLGKRAELRSNGNQKDGNKNKDAEMTVMKPKCPSEQQKCFESCAAKDSIDRSKKGETTGEANGHNASQKDEKGRGNIANTFTPQVTRKENASTIKFPDTIAATYSVLHTIHNAINEGTFAQYHVVEPYVISGPNYAAIPSTKDAPLPQPCYGLREYCNYTMPTCWTPFQRPAVHAGDYFSDDNTVGCSIM